MEPIKPSRQKKLTQKPIRKLPQRTLFEDPLRWQQLPVSVQQTVVDGLTILLLKALYPINNFTCPRLHVGENGEMFNGTCIMLRRLKRELRRRAARMAETKLRLCGTEFANHGVRISGHYG